MTATKALQIGPPALELIKSKLGSINGCFSSSFSVAYPPYCVTFYREDFGSPMGVQIKGSSSLPKHLLGAPVVWKAPILHVGDWLCVDFSQAISRHDLRNYVPYCLPLQSARYGTEKLLLSARAKGKGEMAQIFGQTHDTEWSWQENFAVGQLSHILHGFFHLCDLEDPINAAIYGAKLVGLGVGLTPSGDDFLTAFVSTLHLLEMPPCGQAFVKAFLSVLKSILRPSSTNIWGWSILEPALTGWVTSALIDVLDELHTGLFHGAIDRHARIGASSGMDQLMGVMAALHVYCMFSQKDRQV